MNRIANFLIKTLAGLAYCHMAAMAAPATYAFPEVEWTEAVVPEAPPFSAASGVTIDMPRHVSIKVTVDPDTVAIGSDGVVRYVAIMTNLSGSVNAVYEGIRCTTDEVKTYARWNSAGKWMPVAEPQWKEINGNLPSKHAFAIARQGACENRLNRNSAAETVRALRGGNKAGPGSVGM